MHFSNFVIFPLQFRTAGGTVGLAQLSAVLESKLRSYIIDLVNSGKLSIEDALRIAQSLSATGGHQSASPGIANLPPNLAQIVKDAYGYGVKWAFYSLLPWCSLAAIGSFTLGKIKDTDRWGKEMGKAEEKKETENDNIAGDAAEKTESGEAGPSTSTDAKASAGAGSAKPKKQVGYGPRYRGPFMYLVYGIELLIGTRKRRPKNTNPTTTTTTNPQ